MKIMSWNLQEGLAVPARAPKLVEAIRQSEADVVALSDAYYLESPAFGPDEAVLEESRQALQAEGYEVVPVEYEDSGQVNHGQYLLMLSRLPLQSQAAVRLGNRNGVNVTVMDPEHAVPVNVTGVHFDDRTEALRLVQADDLLGVVDPEQPTVVTGDFNAMHGGDRFSRLLQKRYSSILAGMIPREPVRSIATRIIEMAGGDTLGRLEAAGLHDIDPRHRPTMPSYFPVLNLDHLMASKHVTAGSFDVAPRNSASDHLAIEAELLV